MWCDQCRTDSAADVSAETGTVSCAACGAELGVVRRPATDRARELLQRWSSETPTNEEEPDGQGAPPEPLRTETAASPASREWDSRGERVPTSTEKHEAPAKSDGRMFLMPGPTTTAVEKPVVEKVEKAVEPTPPSEKPVEKTRESVVASSAQPVGGATMPDITEVRSARPQFVSRLADSPFGEKKNTEPRVSKQDHSKPEIPEPRTAPHWAERPQPFPKASLEGEATLPMRDETADPNMDRADSVEMGTSSKWSASGVNLQSRWPKTLERRRGSAGQVLGQVIAYAGVLGITAGLAFVIWGYFGGQTHQMSTGWLIAAGGQMVLMLGFVTIVTEGLEQSRRESLAKLESLEQRLERIEKNIARTALETRAQARTRAGGRTTSDYAAAS